MKSAAYMNALPGSDCWVSSPENQGMGAGATERAISGVGPVSTIQNDSTSVEVKNKLLASSTFREVGTLVRLPKELLRLEYQRRGMIKLAWSEQPHAKKISS